MQTQNTPTYKLFYILVITFTCHLASSVLATPNGSKHYINATTKDSYKFSENNAKILILHPIYAGSHELVLRKMGEFLTEEGHVVTQLRWRYHNMKEVNSSVEVINMKVNNENQRQAKIFVNFGNNFFSYFRVQILQKKM